MRTRVALTSIIIALILLTAALVRYGAARVEQQQEQATLQRQWDEDARRATQRFPPALPRARPDPVELKGMPTTYGLLAGGILLGVGGLAVLVYRVRRAGTDEREGSRCYENGTVNLP